MEQNERHQPRSAAARHAAVRAAQFHDDLVSDARYRAADRPVALCSVYCIEQADRPVQYRLHGISQNARDGKTVMQMMASRLPGPHDDHYLCPSASLAPLSDASTLYKTAESACPGSDALCYS